MAAFDEKDYTKSFDWSIWKRLTPFVRPFRRDFVGMLVFNGLCALVDVAIPLFQRYAIRNFIQADSLRGIVPFSLAYLLVIVLQALSVVAFARNSMTIEMNMGRDMRRSLFHHLQTLSFSFYNVTPVGYLLTRVMSDTNRIASMIAWNMTDILWALFYVLGTFAAMLALNWRLALVVIVIVPVMAVLTGYFQNRILRWNRKVRKLNSRITGSFNEGITGAKTTKTLGTEEQTVAAFRDLTRQMHDAGIGAARLNAVYIPLVLFASTMARGHCAAAGRLYGLRPPAGAGHPLHLHHLRRGHFRAHPDDRRQHCRVHFPAGLHRAGHGPDGQDPPDSGRPGGHRKVRRRLPPQAGELGAHPGRDRVPGRDLPLSRRRRQRAGALLPAHSPGVHRGHRGRNRRG